VEFSLSRTFLRPCRTALFFPCAEAPVRYEVLANKKAADAALLRDIGPSGHMAAHRRPVLSPFMAAALSPRRYI